MNSFFKNNSLLLQGNKPSIVDDFYWIPSENEWYKAAYYDKTLNNGSGGYWLYPTRSNTDPVSVTANNIGNGSAGNTGNFANYNFTADWNNLDGNVTTVGTNGGPSYYDTYDQAGNLWEITDGIYQSARVRRGGSWGNYNFNLQSTHRSFIDSTFRFNNHGFRIAKSMNTIINNKFVIIGDKNNPPDSTGFGSVSYDYQIAIYCVTNNDYVDFLNSIAKTDLYSLYNSSMTSSGRGGIIRNGTSGNYTYFTKTNMHNKPVNFINWFDGARYCNWLSNGRPQGDQNLNTTEDGAYFLNGATSGIISKKIT